MEHFYPFFIILSAGLVLSEFFRKLHLPWVVGLIISGLIIGPHGLNIFVPNDIIEFMSEIGLVFVMFMAGLEINLSKLAKMKLPVIKIAILNSLAPFVFGFLLMTIFGFSRMTSLFVGSIFISSSIAVVIPSMAANNLLHSKVGQAIISATVLEDVSSLIVLSILLQSLNPITSLPLPAFYLILFIVLMALPIIISKIENYFVKYYPANKDPFQQELRSIFTIMVGVVVLFELLGLHPIIAGFFTGMILAKSVKTKEIKQKLLAISYGIFVPIFFINVGTKTDLSVFIDAENGALLISLIVVGSMLTKFVSGLIGGLLSHFSIKQSMLIGVSTIPQLSTTLAVVYVGSNLQVLDSQLVTAMMILTVVTVFFAPLLVKIINSKTRSNLLSITEQIKAHAKSKKD